MKWEMKIICISFVILLASCTNQPPVDEPVVPTRIHTPTQTATPVPTATPTALVLADHGEQTEPYPDLEVITAENVHRLEEVDVWGQGTVLGIALSPDASTIAVSTPTGIYFYNAETMEQIDWIDFYVEDPDCQSRLCWFTYDNLDYSPDGKSLLIGFDDLYLLDLDTKESIRIETSQTDRKPSYIIEAAFNKDGSNILFTRATPAPFGHYLRFEIYDIKSATSLIYYDFQITDFTARIYQVEDYKVIVGPIVVDSRNGKLIREEEHIIHDAIDQVIKTELIAEDQWKTILPQQNITCVIQEDIHLAFSWGMNDISEDASILITQDNNKLVKLNLWNLNKYQNYEQFVIITSAYSDIDLSNKGYYLVSGEHSMQYAKTWDTFSGSVIDAIQANWFEFNLYESELNGIKENLSCDKGNYQSTVENTALSEVLLQVNNCWTYRFDLNPVNTNIFFLDNILYNLSQPNVLIKEYEDNLHYFTPDGKHVAYLIKQKEHPYAMLYFDSVIDSDLVPSVTRMVVIPSVLSMQDSWVYDFQISPSGRYIVLMGANEYLVWDLLEGKSIIVNERAENKMIKNLIFFTEDELLLSRESLSGNGKIIIRDITTNQIVYEFDTTQDFYSGPQISPDGKIMAFLGYDGTIRIYGVRSETK